MSQVFRLPPETGAGRLLDRRQPLRFHFDDRAYIGYAGDTLASALLANGVRIVGRSFKYHRPRGIVTAGAEEPNAVVQLGSGARAEPNLLATQIELVEGLSARSQNRWPSLAFDVGSFRQIAGRLLPAGFYYKTFMWPYGPRWWLRYERLIRRAAGMGEAPVLPDPDRYEHRFEFCDVLVIGAGPAGLAAARVASRSGARVFVAEQSVRGETSRIDTTAGTGGDPASAGDAPLGQEGRRGPALRVLERTCAFGWYDQNLIGLVQHLPSPAGAPIVAPRQRLWKVRARQVVLATGALERPIAFSGNDLPGVMLAGAVLQYAASYGVAAGRAVVLFGNHDGIYAVAKDLARLGVGVQAIVDSRPAEASALQPLADGGIEVLSGHVVVRALGWGRVTTVEVAPVAAHGAPGQVTRRIRCDCVGVSGGWNPVLHLFSQAGGRLRFDETLSAFLPAGCLNPLLVAGAAAGRFGDDACVADGLEAGAAACAALGLQIAPAGKAPPSSADAARPPAETLPSVGTALAGREPSPLWAVPQRTRRGKAFVDFQNDVTVADIALAAREGYRSVEHLKRYTTLGMGTDQGKTGNVVGLALLAATTGRTIAETGTTTFRPPYTPVTLGAFAGRETGRDFAPRRLTPMHRWHRSRGARFTNTGLWQRPQFYPLGGEDDTACIAREAANVRTHAGLVDVSTLGKIEILGPDAQDFLNRVYANRWDTLRIDRCRYGIMLREDGFVLDDGTTARIGPCHFVMSTTTANAARVLQHMEHLLQVVWPRLRVHVVSVTEQWAAMALAGPQSRTILGRICDTDVSDASLPFLACRAVRVAGMPARVFRLTYSGELAYEVHVASADGERAWQALHDAGADAGLVPYGTDAMGVLRIEKGHIAVGAEIDGRTTADDLGLGALVSREKDFVGRRSLTRPAMRAGDRWQLVGLTSNDPATQIPAGANLVTRQSHDQGAADCVIGHVTSSCWSPALGRSIALALLAGGRGRHGELLRAVAPMLDQAAEVTVGASCFVDPEGKRARG